MVHVERLLLVVAVVALGWYATARASTMIYQASQQRQLEELRLERGLDASGTAGADVRRMASETAPETASKTTPGERAATPGELSAAPRAVSGVARRRDTRGLIGSIEIPRLGVSAIVREGVDAPTLRRAVGHVPETALPGDAGNIALAAHRDSFFRPLKDVRAGDVINLRTPDGDFTYVVRETRVTGPAEMSVLAPTAEPTLTLITCYPFHFVGDAPDRFIVRARAVDR
ncbi:MAG TPA: class D sortase [Vicinamibacterales bacterium]